MSSPSRAPLKLSTSRELVEDEVVTACPAGHTTFVLHLRVDAATKQTYFELRLAEAAGRSQPRQPAVPQQNQVASDPLDNLTFDDDDDAFFNNA